MLSPAVRRIASNQPLSPCVIAPTMFAARVREGRVKYPSLGAILLALIPFAATCFSVGLWDRVRPIILGLPFNFFWLILWLLITPLCMWGAYRLETRRAPQPDRE